MFVVGLLAFSSISISYTIGTFWWVVAGTVGVFATLVVTLLIFRQEYIERKERKSEEAHKCELQDRPFENIRCWVKSETEGEISTEDTIALVPAYEQSGVLTLPAGSHWIYLQVFARAGVEVYGVNLRFIGDTVHKPQVTNIRDPHRAPLVQDTPRDVEGGIYLWYHSPRMVAQGRALNYVARIQADAPYTGELSLRPETGVAKPIRIPCTVIRQSIADTVHSWPQATEGGYPGTARGSFDC